MKYYDKMMTHSIFVYETADRCIIRTNYLNNFAWIRRITVGNFTSLFRGVRNKRKSQNRANMLSGQHSRHVLALACLYHPPNMHIKIKAQLLKLKYCIFDLSDFTVRACRWLAVRRIWPVGHTLPRSSLLCLSDRWHVEENTSSSLTDAEKKCAHGEGVIGSKLNLTI